MPWTPLAALGWFVCAALPPLAAYLFRATVRSRYPSVRRWSAKQFSPRLVGEGRVISLDVLAQYYMATFVMTPLFILGAALAIRFESFERDLLWFVVPNAIGQVATYLTVGYVLRGRQTEVEP